MKDISKLRKQCNDVPKFETYQLNKENIFQLKVFNDFQEGFIIFSSYKGDDLDKAIDKVKNVYSEHPICDHYIIEAYALNPKPKELIIRGTTIEGYNTGNISGKHYFYEWHKIKDLDIYLPRKRGK